MLKERHRYRVAPNTPHASRVPGRPPGRVPQRSNMVPLEDVGIVPGNRFILLPLKKVSTIVHRHRWCRSSATSTKTCIVQKATIVSQPVLFQNAPPTHAVVSAGDVALGNNGLKNILRPGSVRCSNRLARRTSLKRRHPHPTVVKTCLSPVSEQDKEDNNSMVRECLDADQGNWRQENRQPGIPGATTTMDYVSLVLIETNTRSNRSKLLSQPSNNASSGSTLVPIPTSTVNGTNCSRAAEGSTEAPSSMDSTTVEVRLDKQLEQLKERRVDREGLEFGAVQRVILHNRIRKFPAEAQQNQLLPVLDQFVTKNQSFNELVDELQKRIAKARSRAELDSVIQSNHERIERAAALKQETMFRGAQQPVVALHQRRANKKLRIVPKIHMFGRNRVSPFSGSVGHKAFQVKSVGQQFLLPPQMSENSVRGVGGFEKLGRFRNWNEDFHGNQSSAFSDADVQKQKYLKGFLCSCTSGDDLPIGPLRTLEEQLLK